MGDGSTPMRDLRPDALRDAYHASLRELRRGFEAGNLSGSEFILARTASVDELLRGLWLIAATGHDRLRAVALVATGGYGRRELFPFSDVDLLFVTMPEVPEPELKQAIRTVSERMWDFGVRFAPVTRHLHDCERVNPENLEAAFALLDARYVAGDEGLSGKLVTKILPKLLVKDGKLLRKGLRELTGARHAKFGDTIFHLEPNIKECPGGLRDTHVMGWFGRLQAGAVQTKVEAATTGVDSGEFREATAFLSELRCFLHLRQERDDNTLDWRSQDAAAERHIGETARGSSLSPRRPDAALWMRGYFRHARTVERALALTISQSFERPSSSPLLRLGSQKVSLRLPDGFEVWNGRIALAKNVSAHEITSDAERVLRLFAEVARLGILPDAALEAALLAGVPVLASRLEDGIGLWHQLRAILLPRHAGVALRAMHAVGLLDLLVPEFHGIDSLVIRDAYHRYTVDEHTFVVIDTLHSLGEPGQAALGDWSRRFAQVLGEVQHPELLYLAALLHDTGKGRSTGDHTQESARMTDGVLLRLELEPYETQLVLDLVRQHLEMSATLRRDIFDEETVRGFAGKVQTQEALRMLVLFTYADLNAVHPDALTSWKAENLWRLYIATSNYLDHSVDEERVGSEAGELLARITATHPERGPAVAAFVEGFPKRYVRTRGADQIRRHFEMAQRFSDDPVQIEFRYAPTMSELTLVTLDRALLFANVSGALAAWGMNIVTADAFSNRQGIVVDSFRFVDNFRTLEMNETERDRFVRSMHAVVSGSASVEKLLSGRRRGRRKVLTQPSVPSVTFIDQASSHSTLLELVSDDSPGLLRSVSLTLAAHRCNIEVALVDTEGERAIDVFYLTREGRKLTEEEKVQLAQALTEAVATRAS